MEQHSGHRDRLRERFMTNGLAGFAPHEVLELLLFYAIPRRDTNALAHALIDRFGSFDRVLEAPAEELMQVPGIGRHCAVLLNTVFACFRYYNQSKQRSRFVATSTAAVMEYVQSLYFGETAGCFRAQCGGDRHPQPRPFGHSRSQPPRRSGHALAGGYFHHPTHHAGAAQHRHPAR